MNKTGVEFLLTDLDLAMTFLAVAEISQNGDTVRRNYDNARTPHDAVVRLLQKLTPNADERRVIDAQLAALKLRLQAVGYQW